jgi:hypothetical protein
MFTVMLGIDDPRTVTASMFFLSQPRAIDAVNLWMYT